MGSPRGLEGRQYAGACSRLGDGNGPSLSVAPASVAASVRIASLLVEVVFWPYVMVTRRRSLPVSGEMELIQSWQGMLG